MVDALNRFCVAIHEAGHAVALRCFNIDLCEVMIHPAKSCVKGEGKTNADGTAIGELLLEQQAIIIVVGPAAECRYSRCELTVERLKNEDGWA